MRKEALLKSVSLCIVISFSFSICAMADIWTNIDMSGATETGAYGIDCSNVVGWCGNHAFIYTIPEPVTLLLLGVCGIFIYRRK